MKFASKNNLLVIVCLLALAATFCRGESILLSPGLPHRETLTEHLVSQLASRTNGTTEQTLGPTDGSNFFSVPPTNKPNFWLLDVTNIWAQSETLYTNGEIGSGGYLTPITQHVCIGAAHATDGTSYDRIWLFNGGYYTNRGVATAYPFGDIILVRMAKTNHVVCKVFPNAVEKIPFWRNPNVAISQPPVFVRFHQGIGRTNQFQTTFVSGSASIGNFGHYWGQFAFGDYSLGDLWIPGDSSGAAFAIVNNEAVLVGTAASGQACPAIANSLTAVNAAISNLCVSAGLPVEQVTLCDLSQFPDL